MTKTEAEEYNAKLDQFALAILPYVLQKASRSSMTVEFKAAVVEAYNLASSAMAIREDFLVEQSK